MLRCTCASQSDAFHLYSQTLDYGIRDVSGATTRTARAARHAQGLVSRSSEKPTPRRRRYLRCRPLPSGAEWWSRRRRHGLRLGSRIRALFWCVAAMTWPLQRMASERVVASVARDASCRFKLCCCARSQALKRTRFRSLPDPREREGHRSGPDEHPQRARAALYAIARNSRTGTYSHAPATPSRRKQSIMSGLEDK